MDIVKSHSFDVKKFQASMLVKGKSVHVVDAKTRLEKIALHNQIEKFCPDVFRGYSDVARRIKGINKMKLFITTYFICLGIKDCQDGIIPRVDNYLYNFGYGYQYELETKQTALSLH